jgi:hypothetical protein
LNSVFAQYEELSSPQFAVINLRLRLITANFGLDNSSYRAQPHSIIVKYYVPWPCTLSLRTFFPQVLIGWSKNKIDFQFHLFRIMLSIRICFYACLFASLSSQTQEIFVPCRKFWSSYILECHIIYLFFTEAFFKSRLSCADIEVHHDVRHYMLTYIHGKFLFFDFAAMKRNIYIFYAWFSFRFKRLSLNCMTEGNRWECLRRNCQLYQEHWYPLLYGWD